MSDELEKQATEIGNAARKKLIGLEKEIEAGRGMRKDLFDVLVSSKLSLANVLKIPPTAPAEALQKLDDVVKQMKTVAGAKINQQEWPAGLDPQSSIGVAALEKAYRELVLWREATFEQRMQAIFKYLGEDSGYQDWCAAFVSWCLKQVPPKRWKDASVASQSSRGALRLFNEFKGHPSTATYTALGVASGGPKPGDIVFWKRADANGDLEAGYGHIGFVFSVRSDGRVTTLEGNSSMSVRLDEYDAGFDKGSRHRFLGTVRLP